MELNAVHTAERLDHSVGSRPVCVPAPSSNGDCVHFVKF